MSEIIGSGIIVLTLGFLLYTLIAENFRQKRLRRVLEYRQRILDRTASTDELIALLTSPSGSILLEDLPAELAASGLRDRMLRTAQTGIVLISVAVGCLVLSLIDSFRQGDLFAALAIMTLFLGAGFCGSAWMAWRVTKSAGAKSATGGENRST